MRIEAGQVWRRYGRNSQDVVTVLVTEVCFVLVEYRDKKYENDGSDSRLREWWPKGWFDTIVLQPTNAGCEVCGKPFDHSEHFYSRVRRWCEEHTPWSGHYEKCSEKMCPGGYLGTEDVMPKIGGKSFHCSCGANVFRYVGPKERNVFQCNACESRYQGE